MERDARSRHPRHHRRRQPGVGDRSEQVPAHATRRPSAPASGRPCSWRTIRCGTRHPVSIARHCSTSRMSTAETAACRPVVGGANIYRDQDHLTVTFTDTLKPWYTAGDRECAGVAGSIGSSMTIDRLPPPSSPSRKDSRPRPVRVRRRRRPRDRRGTPRRARERLVQRRAARRQRLDHRRRRQQHPGQRLGACGCRPPGR